MCEAPEGGDDSAEDWQKCVSTLRSSRARVAKELLGTQDV